MLLSEWNLADAQRVWKEESIAIGEARGEARGIDKLLSLLRQGYSVDEAEKKLLSKKPHRK